jgi:hypothetical protein
MCNQELSVIIALNPNGRAIMTRDMELIRKIFAEIKSWDDARLHSVDIPGVSDAVLQRHLEMLMEGGLIEAQPVGSYNDPFPKIVVKDFSWEGHEIASALLDDGVWKKIKETYTSSELAKLSLKAIGEIAKGLITKWAVSKMGL